MSRPHILVIDDGPTVRRMTELILEQLGGWDTTGCDNGHDGLRLASQHRYDAILLDVRMAPPDGRATLRLLQDAGVLANTPVIYLTAASTPEEVEDLRDDPVADIATKPFKPSELLATLRSAMDRFDRQAA